MNRLVVIGGGFGGSYVAKRLQYFFDTTLIDTKPFFEYTPGILRTLVQSDYENKIRIKHKKYLKRCKIIKGKVTEVDKGYVCVNNKKLAYDYLVISTGSSYKSRFINMKVVMSDTANACLNCYLKFKKAEKILIVGGGLVGVELVGEILDHYKDKDITILQANSRLIERNPEKAINYVERYLRSRNVTIRYNEKLINVKNHLFITDKKNKIMADLCFLCVGINPNSDLMKKNFSHKLDERNHVLTQRTLLLNGSRNIFVIGDLNNLNEEKTAQAAEKQATIVVKNLLRLVKHKQLLNYQPMIRPMVISLGKYNAILIYKNCVLTGKIPAFFKYLIQLKTLLKYKV